MKIWVETRTVDFPTCTVSGRFGSSVMFVAYERILQRWLWVQPGGVVERIAEPPEIFVDDKWARKHALATPRAKLDKPAHIRRGKRDHQMQLEL